MTSHSTINRVREASGIVELVSRYTKLEGRGDHLKGLCPLHQDKHTLSLSVNAKDGVWHCFGCQKGGNVFHWVQEVEGVAFGRALKLLAGEAGIELDRERGAPSRIQRSHAREVAKDTAFYWGALERGYICQLSLVYTCVLQAERWGRCNIEGGDEEKWEQVWTWVIIGPQLIAGIHKTLDGIRGARRADKAKAYRQLSPAAHKATRLRRLEWDANADKLLKMTGELS